MSRDNCPKCNSSSALGQYKCFKCGYRVEYALGTYREIVSNNIHSNDLDIPDNIAYRPSLFHIDALKWLYSSYINDHIILRQGIGYCQNEHRVFIPVITNGTLISYELRKIDSNAYGPKYLSVGDTTNCVHYSDHRSKTVVLVEDHLSAIRIREVYNCISLRGTNIMNSTIYDILRSYDTVVFWLDPDSAGIAGFRKCSSRLVSKDYELASKALFTGTEYTPIRIKVVDYRSIKKDPKLLSNTDISDAISSSANIEVMT